MKRLLLSLALLLTIGAGCASAQVVFDANATASCNTASATTTLNCSTLTVGSGTNRALVCQASWGGTVTSPTLTWDNGGTNQAMTAITSATATNTVVVQLWGLVNPTSGAKQLHAAWTTSRDMIVNCVSFTGVDQTGGATTFPHGTGATGTSATASVTVTSAVNNAVIGVHGSQNNAFSAVNQTQTFNNSTPGTENAAGNRAAGAATVALTATQVSTTWASAGADILAASGGGGCTAPPNQLMMVGVGNCKGVE